MSLTALNWKKLPVRTVTAGIGATAILNNIYDMLTGSLYFDGTSRVTGSNSAWTNVGRFITGSGTGSNTEAVYCYPPTQTAMSQSFVIATISGSGARTQTAAVTAATNESSIAAGGIYAACFKNAGAFSFWTGSGGFGAGSNCSGYAVISNSTNIAGFTKITIYESQEAIGVFFSPAATTTTYGCLSGGIIDPEATVTSVDAESDNRIYGITTTDGGTGAGINTTYLSASSTFLVHSAGSAASRFVTFVPQSSSTLTSNINLFGYTTTTYITASGKLVKVPIFVHGGSNSNFLGRLREISMVKKMPSNQIIRDASSTIVGFTVGKDETTAQDTILLNY
jgi:hypothetical protein